MCLPHGKLMLRWCTIERLIDFDYQHPFDALHCKQQEADILQKPRQPGKKLKKKVKPEDFIIAKKYSPKAHVHSDVQTIASHVGRWRGRYRTTWISDLLDNFKVMTVVSKGHS